MYVLFVFQFYVATSNFLDVYTLHKEKKKKFFRTECSNTFAVCNIPRTNVYTERNARVYLLDVPRVKDGTRCRTIF